MRTYLPHRRKEFRSAGGVPWTQNFSTGTQTPGAIGDAASRTWRAWSFTSAYGGTVDSVTLTIREDGTDDSGTESISVQLWDDDGGSPSLPNAMLTNGTTGNTTCSDLPNNYGSHTFTFSTPPSITVSTKYWIVVVHNDALTTESVTVRHDATDVNGTQANWNGSAWSENDPSALVNGSMDGTS